MLADGRTQETHKSSTQAKIKSFHTVQASATCLSRELML
jgi:hypothetical protein